MPSWPPEPLTFRTFEEERSYRKSHLAAAFRIWGRLGYDEGPAGHITVRDPERRDCFWVNPLGLHFRLVRASDLILVNHDGEVVEGAAQVNRAAFCIHAAIHRARPDVDSAAHCHSIYGRAWSTLGRLLDPLTQDACAFYEDHAIYHRYAGVVYDIDEGQRIAQALGQNKAVILRNHGLLTVGTSPDAAAWFLFAMERSCQVQLAAEAAGSPYRIEHDQAKLTYTQVGTDSGGWFSFQPMYEWIVRREPDLLE